MQAHESNHMRYPRFSRRVARRRSAPAQSMVEFALVSTVLFLMLLGIVEISQLVFTINSVNNGAREGSHWAVLHPSNLTSCAPSCPAATNTLATQQIASSLFLVDTTN